MKKVFLYFMLFGLGLINLQSCTPRPSQLIPAGEPLVIYPDYTGGTFPCNIAPLNFMLRNEEVDAVYVKVKGRTDSLIVNARGRKVIFPIRKWHHLLEMEGGNTLYITVVARKGGEWLQFPAFTWQVMKDRLDAYVSYRLIEPGYEVWNKLQICERCLENFDVKVIADNNLTKGRCMNCHIYGANRGNLSMFHLRGKDGGTILNRDGKLRKLGLRNNRMISAAVYGGFHPSGRYGVFSTNIIIPAFHVQSNRRLEVYDTASDLVIADFNKDSLIFSPLVTDSTVLETFPTFSADGRWVYFCSAPLAALPDSIQKVRYSLCRIAFDAVTGRWGDRVDTLWNARVEAGSICFPKPSPDGHYLLYTVSDYGTFPIWHRETDLQLLDLRNHHIDKLTAVNSNRSDTYHSWASNSRWFAFASKRGDGQYGRIYFSYIDRNGKVYKPFVLPQLDPEDDDLNLKSYNIPELSVTPVPFDAYSVEHIAKGLPTESFK